MFLAGDRVEDGLAPTIRRPCSLAGCTASHLVEFNIDVRDDGYEDPLAHGGVDPKECLRLLGLLSRQDGEQGRALRIVGAPVEDWLHLAAALMDRGRPGDGKSHVQPIELRLAKMAAVNSQENDGMAIAMAGQSVELTRTAIAAVAIREIHAMNFPINHDDPLVKCAAHAQRHEIGNTMHRDMQRAEKSRCR